MFNDKVSITGDPTRAGYAYATWIRGDYPAGPRQSPVADLHSFAYRGQAMISRTTDGGRSWTAVATLPPGSDIPKPGWYSNIAWDPVNDIFYVSKMGNPTYRLELKPQT